MFRVLRSDNDTHYSQKEGIGVLDSIVDKITHMEQQKIRYYCLLVTLVVIVVAIGEQLFSAYKTINYHSDLNQGQIQDKPSRESPYDVEAINQTHLLGQFNEAVEVPKNLPTTNLKLTLRGAFTSSNPEHASAMIESPDGKTLYYKVNSNVNGNTVLHSVFSNRVVLSRQGQLETLYFSTESSRKDPPSARTPPLISSDKSNKQIKTPTAMTQEQRQQLIRSRLQELRNRSRK